MSEEGGRAEGYRRIGPNPGPYPWPGPGPGSRVSENPDPSRRLQVRQHHSVKKSNLTGVYDHRLVYERPSKPRDLSSGKASRQSYSMPRQPGLHGTEDHYMRCRPFEDGRRTPTIPSTHGTHFRNKALSGKFNGLNIQNDRDARKSYQEVGPRSVLSNVLSLGKFHGASAHQNFQEERNRGNNFKLKRKHHSLKVGDRFTYPVSVHPVQPPNLRCKNIVNRESFRQILRGDAAIVPVSETRSSSAGQNKKSRTALKLVCAETSNPDIKISNVDEACATTLSYEESAEDVITNVLGSNLALSKREESLCNSIPSDVCRSLSDTAEYSVMGGLNTRINRGDVVMCPEVHFTTPEGKELKMERYFPPEEDSIECSIHTCGMSSSMVSGVSLEHEMSPSEKLARVLPRRNTPPNMFSTDTIASMTEKEVIEVHNPNGIESSRVGKFLHRASYTTLSGDQSSDRVESDSEILNRYLRDSCNDSDNVRSRVSRAPQERCLGMLAKKISNTTEEQISAGAHTGETVRTKNERYSLSSDVRYPDTFQSTGTPNGASLIQGTDGKTGDGDEKSPRTDSRITDTNERNQDTDTKISYTDENTSSAFVQLLKTAENVPDTAENIPDLAVTIVDITENPDSTEVISCAAEMILDTAERISHPADTSCMTSGADHRISVAVPKNPEIDGRTRNVDKGYTDKAETLRTMDNVNLFMIPKIDTTEPNSSDSASADPHTCRRTSGEMERFSKQKIPSPLSPKYKSWSDQTDDSTNVTVKQSSKINLVVLVSSSSHVHCSEELHLKTRSNDVDIDIREEQIRSPKPEPSLHKEIKRDPLGGNDLFVSDGLIGENEPSEGCRAASDGVMGRPLNYNSTVPQSVSSAVDPLLYEWTNEVKESFQTSNGGETESQANMQSCKQKTLDNAVGLSRLGVQKQGSLMQGYRSAGKSQSESRSPRRNTFPIASRDIPFSESGYFVAGKCDQSHIKTPVAELFQTTETQTNSISSYFKAHFAESRRFEKLSRSDVSCQHNTASDNTKNADCQISFLTNSEAPDLAESCDTESNALQDGLSDNRTGTVCSCGIRRASDKNSVPSNDPERDFCGGSLNKKSGIIFPTEVDSNLSGIIPHSTALDLQQASKKVTVCIVPVEKNEPLDKTVRCLNPTDVSADKLYLVNPNFVKSLFDEGVNCSGRFQPMATQDDFSGTIRSVHQTTRYCREKEDFRGEMFSKAESSSHGRSILSHADESTSSDFTMKVKAQDESHLTAVFRRNSNDQHSSQENLVSDVQSDAVSGRTSLSTNPSYNVSTPTHPSEDNTRSVHIVDKGGTCSIIDQGFEANNENYFSRYDSTRSVEYSSQLVQDRSIYKSNPTKEQPRKKSGEEQLKETVEMKNSSRKIFECQEHVPFCTSEEVLTLNGECDQYALNQNESGGFALVLKGSIRTSEKYNNGNGLEMSYDNDEKRFHIARGLNKMEISDTEPKVLDCVKIRKKDFDCEKVGLESAQMGVEKPGDAFSVGRRSSHVGREVFDCENESLDNRRNSSGNVVHGVDDLEKSFSTIAHCLDSSVKTQAEDYSGRCEHDSLSNDLAQKISQNDVTPYKLRPELHASSKWPDNGTCSHSSQKTLKSNEASDESTSQLSARTNSANTSTDKVIINGIETARHLSGLVCEKHTFGKGSMGGESFVENVEQHSMKNAPESASRCAEKSCRVWIERISRSVVPGVHDSHELTESQATIKLGCVQFGTRPVESIPVELASNTSAQCLDKRDSLRDETRHTSSCGELRSDSEDPVSMAEQLDLGGFDVEVNEENMTAKSLADLSEEDNIPHEFEQRKDEDMNVENVSLSNITDKINESLTATIQSSDGSPAEEPKSEVSNYLVKQSSSGVKILTLDGNYQVSDLVNTTDVIRGFGNQMNVIKSQLGTHITTTSCSQNAERGLSPHIMFIEDEAAACKSFLSLETSQGTETAKCGMRLERSSRGSGRVEWTISVNDENGIETQRSVDIITLNDTTEPSDNGRHSNLEEARESPGISCSSISTQVLMDPTSSPSVGTVRDVSGMAYAAVCKTPVSGIQLPDENKTRTKLTKKRLDKVETRKRVHLFEKDSGNVLETYRCERRKKSFMGCAARTISPDDDLRGYCRRSFSGHSFVDKKAKGGNSRCDTNYKNGRIQKGILMPGEHGISNSNGQHKEQYRSISDLYLTQSARIPSDSEDSDNNALSPFGQSVSPSLLNLRRFTPSNPSSWSTLRHRQIKSSRTASNVLTVPPTHSQTSNKNTSRYLDSDEDIDRTCSRLDTKRRPQRSEGFPSGSSEQLRCPVSKRPGWNMLTDSPEEREEVGEVESGAACLASYVPEGNHSTRVVTFENIPSPRSSLRRSTITPRGESVQTFEPSESCEDATPQPKSLAPLCFCSEDRFLHVSRLSSDAPNCGADELSSDAHMSDQAQTGTSISKNRYYEEIPSISMSHESIKGQGVTTENTNIKRFQTNWPMTPGYLKPRRSSAVQTYQTATRSNSDIRVLTASKTTLLSLAEACGHSTSRLSSPTPSDIPSPPPNPSPNRFVHQHRHSKVDVAVGVNTLECDRNLGARMSDSALYTLHNCNDSTTTIQIPVSSTANHYGSLESEMACSLPLMINASFFPVIPNTGQCSDGKENESDVIALTMSSNIHQKNIAVSRGVVVTSNATDLFNPSTPNSSFEADFFQKSVSADESKGIEMSRGKTRGVASRLRTPPAFVKIADSETTSASLLDVRQLETTDQLAKNMSDGSVNFTDSSPYLAETDGNKVNKHLVMGGNYRFGSAGQRSWKYSDLMDDMIEVNTAVPSRSTLSRSSGPTSRLSPSFTIGSHTRYAGARIFESRSMTGEVCSSNLIECRGCHRERQSYAQKPKPKLIKRPADASCRSSTPSKTSNNARQFSDEAKQRTAEGEDYSRPLPPAALDQSEEGFDSKQGACSFSNAGVTTDPLLEIGRGTVSVTGAGTSTVRFSDNLLKSQVGNVCAKPRGQGCFSTVGTECTSYVRPLSSSTPGTTGKSATTSLRESTGQDVSSMTRHDVSTPTTDPLMDQLSPSFGGTAQCGVICPETNESNRHPKQNMCLSMKSRNSSAPSINMTSGQESRVTQVSATKPSSHTPPTAVLGRYSTCVPINESPDSTLYDCDVNSETQKSRGTLTSQSHQGSKVTESAHSQGKRSSRSPSTHSCSNKRKSSSSHSATGSKTGRGSVRKHVNRTSSKTVQPKPDSFPVLDKPANPPPTATDIGPQDQSRIPRVTSHDNCGEEEASYIAEVLETTGDIPSDRLEREGDCTSVPAPQVVNAESLLTETSDLSSEALPRSLTRSDELFARPDDYTSSRGMADLVTDMAKASTQSYHAGSSRGSASEPTTEQGLKSLATVQGSGKVLDAKAHTSPQLQVVCVSDAICKTAQQPSPGKRYGLYTSRVGYIGPPRPTRPIATNPSRVKRPVDPTPSVPRFQSKFHYYVRHQFYKNKKSHQTMGVAELPVDLPNDFTKKQSQSRGPVCPVAENDIQFPFILARPEAKPKRKCQTIYDEARDKAPFKEERCERDYVHANIQNVCQSVPLKRPARFVDSIHGHTQLLEPSGLEPRYVFRKDYGVVPTYLSQAAYKNGGLKGKPVGSCLRSKSKAVPTSINGNAVASRDEQTRKHPLRYITEPERAQLLEGLKQNWQELTTVFQGLPVMTDTMAKMKRKQTLEKELRQLEKDIATIEQNPIIYIDQGAGDSCNAAHIWVD